MGSWHPSRLTVPNDVFFYYRRFAILAQWFKAEDSPRQFGIWLPIMLAISPALIAFLRIVVLVRAEINTLGAVLGSLNVLALTLQVTLSALPVVLLVVGPFFVLETWRLRPALFLYVKNDRKYSQVLWRACLGAA